MDDEQLMSPGQLSALAVSGDEHVSDTHRERSNEDDRGGEERATRLVSRGRGLRKRVQTSFDLEPQHRVDLEVFLSRL